jgi:exopolysaccharide production protein ExoY
MKAQMKSELFAIKYGETSSTYEICKRLIDILGALMGILFTLPVILIIIGFYQFGENKGPVIFKQIRVGKNNQKFHIYKFRTMVIDAENRLKSDKELYQKYIQNNYKLEPHEDFRITKFGRILRTTSLDELPQLINVLKGQMSLVGPRPVVVEELKEYKSKKEIFLSVKPGLTGYWQVCGRSDVGYPERVDLELYYVYNRTLLLDIQIILQTVIKVIVRKGAY